MGSFHTLGSPGLVCPVVGLMLIGASGDPLRLTISNLWRAPDVTSRAVNWMCRSEQADDTGTRDKYA